MKNKKAFTLIELIAVLVILAILALIVTPLVLNIIKKARTAADKRSIDAYGRSIELAIADYLLDKGEFPTSIEQLTIEYTGDEVVCSTTRLNNDSSVYLAECTVGGRSVAGYTYGKEEAAPTSTAYSVGDEVTYNNVDYRVIKDSSTSESSVTLLKSEPLTYEEVQTYSNGTGAQTSDQNGYGGMQYHSESNSYATSYVKTTVDAWKAAQAPAASEARLLVGDDFEGLGYEMGNATPSDRYWVRTANVPSWVYNSNYYYWTMDPKDDSSRVWYVYGDGDLNYNNVSSVTQGHYYGSVRPVITLLKSELN